MPPTIGLVANVFQEANALPGWIETHLPFFDDVRVTHSGPQGQYSTDGTIELLEKWKIPVDFDSIDDGFGAVRSRTMHRSPCDYVMLLDADERFFPVHRIMNCSGKSTPHSEVDAILQTYDFHDLNTMIPNWENVARLGAELVVNFDTIYDQGQRLRDLLSERPDAVCTMRRHWHDFSFKKPTQNWHTDPDWQMRTIRNHPSIHFSADTRMHERLVCDGNSFNTLKPVFLYFDHFHFTFKRMEQWQRGHDLAIYNAIHEGKVPPTWEQFKK